MARIKKTSDEDILKIILEVIIQKGPIEFSLEDLKEKTLLSPATLLQRFESKQKILHKALELANTNLNRQELNTRIPTTTSAIEEIINIYLNLAKFVTNPSDVANGLGILQLDITDKKLNTLTRKHFAIRQEKIESLLILAQKSRKIHKHINTTEMTLTLETLWQGAIIHWALIGEGKLQAWLERRLRDFFSNMIIDE